MPSIKYKKKTYAGATFPVLEMTKAEYDALPEAKKMDGTVYMITDDTGGWEAENSAYDNTESGLTATNVQSALDELDSKISGIGQIVYSLFSTEVSVGSSATIIGSVNLSKGVWIAIGEIRYTKASSRLFCRLSLDNVITTVDEGVNSTPCTSPPLRLQSTRIITVLQNSATLNLIGYSDEASNTATGLIRAIRIV